MTTLPQQSLAAVTTAPNVMELRPHAYPVWWSVGVKSCCGGSGVAR